MTTDSELDLQAAHRYFSARCFNQTWDLIEKAERTPDEDQQMIGLTMASMWHWTQRADCTAENLSVAYWQASRVYALVGQADNARRYGQLCLEVSRRPGVGPFFLAYALEALARAEMVAGDRDRMAAYRRQAQEAAEDVPEMEDRQLILNDLASIG